MTTVEFYWVGGTMPSQIGQETIVNYPVGMNSQNTVILGARVLRNGGIYVYGYDGLMFHVYQQASPPSIHIGLTETGTQYIAGQIIALFLMKV